VKLTKFLKTIRENEHILTPWLSFLIPFLIYLTSLPPGVTWGDSPELANSAITLGVAHPSGYPLFIIIGKLFSLLPFSSPAFGINLMSAFLEAGAVVWIFLIIRRVSKNGWTSLAAVILFSLTYTFWMHGRIIEVYALNNFLIGAILYFMFRWIEERKIKDLYMMSIFFGLGFTNHLTIVLFFPAVLFMFITTDPKIIFKPKPMGIMIGIIFLFQILYLYIPWRAAVSGGETMVWNNPDSWKKFIYHVTGNEYSVFRKGSSLIQGITRFSGSFNREFTPLGVILVFLGAVELLATNWRFGGLLLLYFASLVIYNSTYVVQDIGSYYMAPYMAAAIALGIGASWLQRVRTGKGRFSQYTGFVIPLAITFTAYGLYGKNWDLKYKDNLADSFASQAFKALPEKSIFMTDIDGPSFAMWYQAYSIHPKKRGKAIVTKGMFSDKGKKWYRDFLKKRHPSINWPTEQGKFGNHIIQKLVKNNYGKTPVYAAFYFRVPIQGYSYINRGWISEIVKTTDLKGKIKPNKNLRWAYLTPVTFANKKEWYDSATRSFSAGDTVGCVAEWTSNHSTVKTKWIITNPQGRVLSSSNAYALKGQALAVHKFKIKRTHVMGGKYKCNIYLNGKLCSSLEFSVTD
jgi:Protein O-mannosyl-transferase TMEM260-like